MLAGSRGQGRQYLDRGRGRSCGREWPMGWGGVLTIRRSMIAAGSPSVIQSIMAVAAILSLSVTRLNTLLSPPSTSRLYLQTPHYTFLSHVTFYLSLSLSMTATGTRPASAPCWPVTTRSTCSSKNVGRIVDNVAYCGQCGQYVGVLWKMWRRPGKKLTCSDSGIRTPALC